MKILSNKSKYFLHFDLEYGIIISVVKIIESAPIAQLDRVFGYEPKDRGFESLWAYHVGTSYARSDFFYRKNRSHAPLFLLFPTKPPVLRGPRRTPDGMEDI